MASKDRMPEKEKLDPIAEAHREIERRQKTYRERALKIFPWICARCGREFAGKKLRELTVHHRDHNHDNNPPDGSNWELMCLYCHDNEHSRNSVAECYTTSNPVTEKEPPSTYKPFAGLDSLVKNLKKPT